MKYSFNKHLLDKSLYHFSTKMTKYVFVKMVWLNNIAKATYLFMEILPLCEQCLGPSA